MLLNAPFSMSVHLNCTLCLTICCKGFTICAKSGTNLQTKFIVPMKDCIPFLLWGKGIYAIASILSRSMEIPFLEMMWPNNFPSNTVKTHFLGFEEIPYFRQQSKICFRWNICSSLFLDKTVTSSRYTTTLWPIKPQKAISISLWKVAPALMRPKRIL